MNKFIKLSLLVSLTLLCTTACSNPKKTLGLTRTAPDEFTVVSQSPLTLPPDFNLLPPSQNEISVRDTEVTEKAKNTLFSSADVVVDDTNKLPNNDSITDESSLLLLTKAGAVSPDKNIRETIAKETSLLIEADKTFTDKLIFWNEEENDPTSTIVDAQKEKQRIQENMALGKPINDGETPTIARKKKALLDFN